MVRQVGGLWPGSSAAGIAETDIDEVMAVARDALVERMMVELPFPDDLDRDCLRAALRSYAAFAGSAIEAWLRGGSLTEAQTRSLLLETLLAISDSVVPAMPSV